MTFPKINILGHEGDTFNESKINTSEVLAPVRSSACTDNGVDVWPAVTELPESHHAPHSARKKRRVHGLARLLQPMFCWGLAFTVILVISMSKHSNVLFLLVTCPRL